jgi:hypothetical protein
VTGVEMFLVQPHHAENPGARQQIAEWVTLAGGLVLMATSRGSLIVGLPHERRDELAGHPQVALVGGVNLHPNGRAAAALREHFERNAARQAQSLGDALQPTIGRQPDRRKDLS